MRKRKPLKIMSDTATPTAPAAEEPKPKVVKRKPPPGYELYEPASKDELLMHDRHLYWADGRFMSLGVHLAHARELGEGPYARRVYALGELPFTEIPYQEKLTPGCIIFDQINSWFPHAGPTNTHGLGQVSGSYSWITAAAVIKPEVLGPDHILLGNTDRLYVGCEVLICVAGKYLWKAVDADANGWPVWLYDYGNNASNPAWCARRPKNLSRSVESFMSKQLLGMLRSEPTADVVRGLIRKELHVIIPKDMHQRGDVKEIEAHIEKEYATRPATGGEIRMLRYAEHRGTHRRAYMSATPNIDTVRMAFTIEERESGRTYWRRDDTITGFIDVPRNIIDQGESHVRTYIQDQYHDGALDGGAERIEGRVVDTDSGSDETTVESVTFVRA